MDKNGSSSARTSRSSAQSARSGERYWKSHAIFKFAKDPVNAYDLFGLFAREFPDVES